MFGIDPFRGKLGEEAQPTASAREMTPDDREIHDH
jgi:hypothetical protein